MKRWEEIRKESISEHILVAHVISVLIFFMAFLTMTNVPLDGGLYKLILISLMGAFIGLAVFYYIVNRIVSGVLLASNPNLTDSFLLLFSYITAVSILFLTGKADSIVKIIFIIPVIIASTSLGKTAGLITAGFSGAILFYFDFKAGFEPGPSVKFQADIINSMVLFTLAWLFGGFADTERVARENLTLLANTDDLTGMSNHRHFQEVLRESVESAEKNNKSLSLIKLDIDYFKFYNKNYGYQQGDEVLIQVAGIINSVVKWRPCFAARYGSDEFTVIVPDTNSEGLKIAERIRKKIETHSFPGAEVLPNGRITVSLGVAGFPEQGSTPEGLLRLADEAMYKAKYSRNRVQLYFSVIDDLRDSFNGAERDFFHSIKTLLTIINAKDRYTFGHSERVVYYSLKLAEKLNFTTEEMLILRYGAILHDIGKLEISRDILNSTEALKPSDLAILQKHPEWGGDIVRPISSLKKVIPTIIHHHENYDGTGYPEGLAGEGIPLQARILRITDSFDAMTTDRPYKKAKNFVEACAELKSCSGSLFDPGLVDVFLKLIAEIKNEHPDFNYLSSTQAGFTYT
ncbi:Cyclic di-GMP phosphodiesterase response regulator RpfG [Pelotomaculum schinkii]|uniref:Cyclic di-GMP phosphodiesterase response regulator RpfG n=1 Tax=Pelotomaculum schinkii TaxID=78350 RepID=A0A4Y7RBP6_9FIRM|nr:MULTISPECIES: diguanylate cyclase [Pelotomaculum]TEB05757.1 Cyclic di-GMP phosphodiesterase response regulator RpfG [Pelotomaculum schinkii]TEB17927.1 Cyclic di-GMP phosphodiesterase response regulator RpfG [Pelotomaculum sp. FP]